MALISIEHVNKSYRLDGRAVDALRDVSLAIDEGVLLAIAGPSGSGKSTLLNLIGCIDSPDSGRIVIDGNDVTGRTPDQLAANRARTVGFIFQTFNLFPMLTARENVEYPLLQFPELSAAQRRDRVASFLRLVDLTRFARHRPNQLSGGQRQRVAIARALATKPRIVLADEPTANLDHDTGSEILGLMRAINAKYGTTFVFSTHDERVISAADRLVRIEDGRIRALAIRSGVKWRTVRPLASSDGPGRQDERQEGRQEGREEGREEGHAFEPTAPRRAALESSA
ncbi:MAG: ABC transporter ATP-binding protein [Burkholderiaceae bacterium]|nr:ABC transporter ATP-binding protein [Burkholderiaceae bacterium]